MDKEANGITDHSPSPSFGHGGLANKKQRIVKIIRIYNPSFSESELDNLLSKRVNNLFESATNRKPTTFLEIQDSELSQKLYNEIADSQGIFMFGDGDVVHASMDIFRENGGDVLSDVSSMLPTANPMSVITPMAKGGGVSREVRVMQDMNGFWVVQIWTNQWVSYSEHRFFQDAYQIKEMIEKNLYSESSIINKIEEQNKYGLSKKIAPYHFNLERTKYANGGGVGEKYYVVSAKEGKVVSIGFDTEEEAKKEMYKLFEKTNDISYATKKMADGGGVDNSKIGSYYLTWDFNKDGDLSAKKGNKEFVIKADTHIGKGNYDYALFTNGVKYWFTGDISSLKKTAQRQSQETMAKGGGVGKPKMVRSHFEEEEFGEFKNGGGLGKNKFDSDKLTEQDLDRLITESIKECNSLPHVCEFVKTKSGFERVFNRVKQHILIRGIDNVDTALALVGQELEQPYAENPNN
jgi:hypothetical protein